MVRLIAPRLKCAVVPQRDHRGELKRGSTMGEHDVDDPLDRCPDLVADGGGHLGSLRRELENRGGGSRLLRGVVLRFPSTRDGCLCNTRRLRHLHQTPQLSGRDPLRSSV